MPRIVTVSRVATAFLWTGLAWIAAPVLSSALRVLRVRRGVLFLTALHT
jgi:hypothetical protein